MGVWELVGVASFAFKCLRGTKDRRGRLSGIWRPLIWAACTSAVGGGKMKQRWREDRGELDEEKGRALALAVNKRLIYQDCACKIIVVVLMRFARSSTILRKCKISIFTYI